MGERGAGGGGAEAEAEAALDADLRDEHDHTGDLLAVDAVGDGLTEHHTPSALRVHVHGRVQRGPLCQARAMLDQLGYRLTPDPCQDSCREHTM